MVKTVLTLGLLLPLAGCCDFGWGKKNNNVQADAVKSEVATHGHAGDKAQTKCSHKGCTHDHSKDAHKKHAHNDDVKTQGMDDDMDDNMDMNDDEDNVAVQSMDDMDDMDDNEDYSA